MSWFTRPEPKDEPHSLPTTEPLTPDTDDDDLVPDIFLDGVYHKKSDLSESDDNWPPIEPKKK